MRTVAIIYASRRGQTRRIADAIRRQAVGAGCRVVMLAVTKRCTTPLPRVDHLIVGGAIQVGRIPRALRLWLRSHRDMLAAAETTSFFAVALNPADPRPEARRGDRELLDRLVSDAGWTPDHVAVLAGALHYTKYNVLLRWWMRRIAARAGGPTDTTRDHELTDWGAVAAFTEAALTLAPSRACVAPPRANTLAAVRSISDLGAGTALAPSKA